jgi:hypothetical protein
VSAFDDALRVLDLHRLTAPDVSALQAELDAILLRAARTVRPGYRGDPRRVLSPAMVESLGESQLERMRTAAPTYDARLSELTTQLHELAGKERFDGAGTWASYSCRKPTHSEFRARAEAQLDEMHAKDYRVKARVRCEFIATSTIHERWYCCEILGTARDALILRYKRPAPPEEFERRCAELKVDPKWYG